VSARRGCFLLYHDNNHYLLVHITVDIAAGGRKKTLAMSFLKTSTMKVNTQYHIILMTYIPHPIYIYIVMHLDAFCIENAPTISVAIGLCPAATGSV
jgi:hypothetical protein